MKNERIILPELYTFTTWDSKKITKIPNEVLKVIKERKQTLLSVPKKERNFKNTIFAIEALSYNSFHKLLLLNILMNLSPKENIRKEALKAEEVYEKESIDILLDDALYGAFKEYINGNYKKEKGTLGSHEVKLVDDLNTFFKNNGFELQGKQKKEFKENLKKCAELSSRFGFNINSFNQKVDFTTEELQGLSSYAIDVLEKDKKTELYKVPAQGPIYMDYMKLGKNRNKRKELAETALLKGGKENISILEKLVVLRDKNAKLLGYKNHVDATLSTRMAKDHATAYKFLQKIYKRVHKKSKQEKLILDNLAKNDVGKSEKAEFYDISFYSNKLYEETAKLDTEYIKQFFETNNTFVEMLSLYSETLSLTFKETNKLPTWHSLVKVLEVCDKKSKHILGYIYIDLYPRDGKYNHAMVAHATNGYRMDWQTGEYVMPVCALVCNFTSPSKKVPSLLNLSDVETLFHEFGHALHSVLTQCEFESQSGTNVTHDFVETPSQMLENFLYEKENLKKISRHYKTKKSLDVATIEKIIKNKNFMIASFITRQLLFGFFDLAIHDGLEKKNTREIYNTLYKKITGYDAPKNNLFPAGFGHMVGYDAGYYSYMWALVYAQDIYSKFIEAKTKTERQDIGLKYRREILEVGSSREEMISVKKFLGRKPTMQAFFKTQQI